MKHWIIFVAVLTVMCSTQCPAQLETWPDDDTCHLYNHLKIQHMPPVNPSMPWDVLVAYIALDSLFRTGSRDELFEYAMALPKDSIEMGLKYWFRARDYDPLLAEEFLQTSRIWPGYQVTAAALFRLLEEAYFDRFGKWEQNDRALLLSDFIHHVRVMERSETEERTKAFGLLSDRYCALVEPVEKLVGQIIPNLCLGEGDDENPGECYRLGWGRSKLSECENAEDSAYALERGPDVMEPGEEYLVFLSYGSLPSADSLTARKYILGGNEVPRTNWALQIIDGNVQDKENTLGLGESIPLQEFKDYIFTRRAELLGL